MDETDRYVALGERYRELQTTLFDARLHASQRAEIEAELERIAAERASLASSCRAL